MNTKEYTVQACETLISMLTAHLMNGKPNAKTIVSNLRLFADGIERCLEKDE